MNPIQYASCMNRLSTTLTRRLIKYDLPVAEGEEVDDIFC